MCGIVGYIGEKDAVPVLIGGLRRLEYRGYDSAGVAVVTNGSVSVRKRVGKLRVLAEDLEKSPLPGKVGVGHTRWATHGAPSEVNSHPHSDNSGTIHLVHNGIIENYQSLKERMIAEGHTFRSQTDTEVVAHLVGKYYRGDLAQAVRDALKEVEGAYAIGVVCDQEPDVLVAARCGSPLIVGLGEGENFIASDVPAILNHTRRIIYLDDHEVIRITKDGVTVTDLDGNVVEKPVHTIEWDASAAEKGGYPHFMLKEIHEQPQVIRDTLRGRFAADGSITLDDMRISDDELRAIKKIVIISCGTAWHAGLVGKYLLESFVGIPCEVDLSSEFRYRNPLVDESTLVMTVTQSGETADTLAGLREAKRRGSKVVSICNVVGSSIARESNGVIYQHAGPEIGVASTKAYTSQVTCFVLFTMYLGRLRGVLSDERISEMVSELRELPGKIEKVLADQSAILECTEKYHTAQSSLYLGRSYNFPSALEGALKLKEISYIHAEGYAAGEMKHGPIALVDPSLPVVCVCVKSAVYDKMISNIQEIRARSGKVIAVATEGDTAIMDHADDVLYIPETPEYLSPIVVAVPLQLLAYHIAVRRGCDVDQPRNLAKSVTVE
ncbi:MAG: glutamine--fructose-6-phosphate aminotransferase [isomerizing] [Armatimonadota bacterium]|nr:MAG: glutamine--fructose-6-phosphate aminotransferase [isomerizing] [Armatimonadota bacterium]